MFGTGGSVGRGSGDDWGSTRRSGVRVTAIGWVEALKYRRRIDKEGVRSGSGVPSDVIEVRLRVMRSVGLGFGDGELMVLS